MRIVNSGSDIRLPMLDGDCMHAIVRVNNRLESGLAADIFFELPEEYYGVTITTAAQEGQ
ncbi:hypothetical protein ACLOJK_007375 [Asimina triloba]